MSNRSESRPSSLRLRWRWKRILFLAYAVTLVASHVVRLFQPSFVPRSDQRTAALAVVENDSTGADIVHLSYVDSHPDDREGRAVVFVLHGSPAASMSMMGVHRGLSGLDSLRIITPDLPGFGGSTLDIPDYSVRGHARYLVQLMDTLNIRKAHFLAYSMAGGIVLEIYRSEPDRVSSVTMLSAIGVQELELMGDYLMNHSVHAVQLAGLWLIQEGFPHFGWMDDAFLTTSYARNFFDTDQRPLRGILEEYSAPMLIVHGRDDSLVPYEAALEHHRIVPHSTMITFPEEGHGMPFVRPDTLAAIVARFVGEVDAGSAQIREDASSDRLREASRPFDTSSIPPVQGAELIVLMILIATATLVNEDLACIGAGLMAARGTLTLFTAFGAAFGGIILGDVLLYALGRGLGSSVVRRVPFRWFIREESLKRGSAWFEKRGFKVIFVSRFLPGMRLPTYVAAGVLKAPFRTFLGYFLLASLVWAPMIVGVSTLLGNQILNFYSVYESFALLVLLGLVALIYAAIHIFVPAFSHRGRRRLLSNWRRLSRWEFWHPFVFYPPVVLYIFWLGIKHRSLAVFTAANPGISHGGFVGESKFRILSALKGAGDVVAAFTVVQTGENGPARVREFMSENRLQFPVVLKPDIGERGSGVLIAGSEEKVHDYFDRNAPPTIVQEFADGREYGVFYYRMPSEETGHIFSITDKRLPAVTGDGQRTLLDLILDDDRAVSMAPLHLGNHADRIDSVPAIGKRVELVSVGTHRLGALFLDGSSLRTTELEAAFDRISKTFDGFFFGRFDVRTNNIEEFQRGKDFRIVELNGVTSESTHIYDPSCSLMSAYRTLFRQWRIAFEIGAENVKRGAEVETIRNLIRLVYRHKILQG